MNKLPIEKRVQISTLLVEGNSLRSCSRIADVSINTVTKLLVNVGTACEKFHNDHVVAVNSKRIQCDEIWSFVGAKQKNVTDDHPDGYGDCYTFTAIDPVTKLMPCWLVGIRSKQCAMDFMALAAGPF